MKVKKNRWLVILLAKRNTMSSGDNNIGGQLKFERIEKVSVLSNFFCGVSVMDKFIHSETEGLQHHMDNTNASTFVVRMNNEIVAFFSINEYTITLDDDSKEDMEIGVAKKPEKAFENPDYLKQTEFTAIEIAYLAVKESKRKQGIGHAIIMAIAEKAGEIVNGCEFLKVDAYHTNGYSAVGFYTKVGFDKLDSKPNSDVWPMIYVINPHEYNDDEDE